MNTERDTELRKLHGAINRAVGQLSIDENAPLSKVIEICLDAHNSTAALQKRIEALEAQVSFARNKALEEAALICEQLARKYDISIDPVDELTALESAATIRAIKAGDVQAPKEGIDEVTLKFHHGIGEYSLDSIEAFGYGNHVEIRYDSHKTDKNAAIIHAVHKLRAAAPTDTEGK